MQAAHLWLAATTFLTLAMPAAAQSSDPPVKALKVTVLSTMLVGNAREGVGEWGFAAVLEVDGLADLGRQQPVVVGGQLGAALLLLGGVGQMHGPRQ